MERVERGHLSTARSEEEKEEAGEREGFMEPIIEFKNFSFKYRSQKEPTIRDINLSIYPGEKVLIVGPSGSGKSTLAHCINGLEIGRAHV